MADELGEEDPFADDEKEHEPITEGMVKKVTFLMHKYADQRHEDYKEVQKKCKNYFAYSNLAKMSITEGHAMITKLIELTGGEETQPQTRPQAPTKPTEKAVVLPAEREQEKEKDDLVTSTMRKAIRAAVDITNNEIVAKEIPVMGLGGVVLEIGKVIFEAKMAEEVNK